MALLRGDQGGRESVPPTILEPWIWCCGALIRLSEYSRMLRLPLISSEIDSVNICGAEAYMLHLKIMIRQCYHDIYIIVY
jgi:hypothetical protein